MSIVGRKRNRDHLHIIGEILEHCRKSRSKTEVMRSLNLSHRMLVSYLAELECTKLIEPIPNTLSKRKITPKGEEYLRKFRELQKIADFPAVDCSISTNGGPKEDYRQIRAKDRKLKVP